MLFAESQLSWYGRIPPPPSLPPDTASPSPVGNPCNRRLPILLAIPRAGCYLEVTVVRCAG
eukprot:366114-Chlamydomonas_euryale.AAC.3